VPSILGYNGDMVINHSNDPAGAYTVRLAHLYPSLMNLYGDRGNIITLRRRCEQRGISLIVTDLSLGDEFDPAAYDLVFIGGGQDREQRRIAEDLLAIKGAAIREAAADGMPMLTVCGGYQLFGRSYQPGAGEELPGLGIFPSRTVHPGEHAPRCIGNVEAAWDGGSLVGFENHGGRTYLEDSAQPLARVLAGYGNNGEDGTEGAVVNNVYGTYLHGSLLPKNPAFADHLLLLALRRRYGADVVLTPLDDALEAHAHATAARVARTDATRGHGVGRTLARLVQPLALLPFTPLRTDKTRR
jgi:CobQ-like glutamine amidotransferase family enzyme